MSLIEDTNYDAVAIGETWLEVLQHQSLAVSHSLVVVNQSGIQELIRCCKRFRAKWTPARVKKTRQTKIQAARR
jgi:hypothetical protein